jgi:hypothetical protein
MLKEFLSSFFGCESYKLTLYHLARLWTFENGTSAELKRY